MATRAPLSVGEWYHCYNRGFEKSKTYRSSRDYHRFLLLMYLSNGEVPVHIREKQGWNLYETLQDSTLERGRPLVEIGAYTLMGNHFHLILKEIRDGGIALFMQKLCTGYTMYFNKKYERTGALFGGTFKSKHLYDDLYLKKAVSYVFLNPLELFEPRWKDGLGNLAALERRLQEYPYTSLRDFFNNERPEKIIVGNSLDALYDRKPAAKELLAEARAYYQERAGTFT